MKRLLVLCLLAAAVLVPVARADGDPASDFFLLTQRGLTIPARSTRTRPQGRSRAARRDRRGGEQGGLQDPRNGRSHLALRPSLASPPSGRSRRPYARFLALELSFVYKGPLLVVSPKGYGFNGGTAYEHETYVDEPDPKSLALVRTLPIGKGTSGLLATAAGGAAAGGQARREARGRRRRRRAAAARLHPTR